MPFFLLSALTRSNSDPNSLGHRAKLAKAENVDEAVGAFVTFLLGQNVSIIDVVAIPYEESLSTLCLVDRTEHRDCIQVTKNLANQWASELREVVEELQNVSSPGVMVENLQELVAQIDAKLLLLANEKTPEEIAKALSAKLRESAS